MTDVDSPRDGDFAGYLERQQARQQTPEARPEAPGSAGTDEPASTQSIDDILLRGEEPTDAFVDEWNEAERNPVSEAELERQALEHPGADGDPSTPE